MFRFVLLVGLIMTAIALVVRTHRRLQHCPLVDLAPSADTVLHGGWAILLELWPSSGVLAAAMLALAPALGLSHLHRRVILRRQRDRLDRIFRDHETFR